MHLRVKKKKAEKEAKKKAAAKKGAKKGKTFSRTGSTSVSPAKPAPARRDTATKPDLKKNTSTSSSKVDPKDSKKDDTLKPPKLAANLSKTMTTPAKINLDDQSMISSPELQRNESDLPLSMDPSASPVKQTLTVHMHPIQENNGEEEAGLLNLKQSMIEIHSREDTNE